MNNNLFLDGIKNLIHVSLAEPGMQDEAPEGEKCENSMKKVSLTYFN